MEATLELSQGFGGVSDRLREPGLRDPYGAESAQTSEPWVSQVFIPNLWTGIRISIPLFSRMRQGPEKDCKASKLSLSYHFHSPAFPIGELLSLSWLPFSPPSNYPIASEAPELSRFFYAQPPAKSTFPKTASPD